MTQSKANENTSRSGLLHTYTHSATLQTLQTLQTLRNIFTVILKKERVEIITFPVSNHLKRSDVAAGQKSLSEWFCDNEGENDVPKRRGGLNGSYK